MLFGASCITILPVILPVQNLLSLIRASCVHIQYIGNITHTRTHARTHARTHTHIYKTQYIFIMKTMCSPGFHHNGFVATHALEHMMYGYTLLVPVNQRVLNNVI